MRRRRNISLGPIVNAVCLAALGAGCSIRFPQGELKPEKLPPEVAAEASPTRTIDRRPYEFIWAERREPYEPTLDFEGLLGWTVEAGEDTQVDLERTAEKQLWGRYVGKVTFSGPSEGGMVSIHPPEPVEISEPFDAVDLWVHGQPEIEENMGPEVAVLLEGRSGEDIRLPLVQVDWQGWWLVHKAVDENVLQQLEFPCHVLGLELKGLERRGATNYFDSLAFYTERRQPLSFEQRPSPRLERLPGQIEGLHTGSERLPFPTRPEGIMPSCGLSEGANAIERVSDDVYLLKYAGEDGELIYRFSVKNGLEVLEATWNGAPLGRLVAGANVTGLEKRPSEVLVLRASEDVVHVEYSGSVEYDLRMSGKCLVFDVQCRGGEATGVSLGRVAGARHARPVEIPFLKLGEGPAPAVAAIDVGAGEEASSVFVGVWIDWYRSNASELYVVRTDDPDALAINGGARYLPLTDGTRNDVIERVYVAVSPRIEEVLPSIPNPTGRHAVAVADRVGIYPQSCPSYGAELDDCSLLARYGITETLLCAGDWCWRDGEESRSLRTRGAFLKGGDTGLVAFVSGLLAQDWHVGLYANYGEISPLSQHWSADFVQRMSDRNWRRGAGTSYALKAPRAVEFHADIAPRIKASFSPNATLMSEHILACPWENTDYDARVPGAGTFAQPFYSYGEILLNESRIIEGPVIGSGGCLPLYAGLADAFWISQADPGFSSGKPYIPVFDLQSIHPLSCEIGMGSFESFFEGRADWSENLDRALDEYLCAQIAYGHTGRLPDPDSGLTLICRAYYLIQQLQTRYALKSPRRISYWDGTSMLSVSKALARGVHHRSQMYFEYPDGLELWVNGSAQETWDIRVGRETWKLPPFAWVAVAPDFMEVSAEVDGRRIDFVKSDAYIYYDGRGSKQVFKGLSASTPIALRAREDVAEVIDIAKQGRFGIAVTWFGGAEPRRCRTYAEDGSELAAGEITLSEDVYWISGPKDALQYVIDLSAGDAGR